MPNDASRLASAASAAPSSRNENSALVASMDFAEAIRRGDGERVLALTESDFTFIDTSGTVHPRQGLAEGIRSELGPPVPENQSVGDYGDVALIAKRWRASGGEDVVELEVWIRRDGDWRALTSHLNRIAGRDASVAHPTHTPRPPDAPPPECENPCEFVPYEPRSPDERDLITTFQTLEKAVTRNDADEWVKHVADEFIVYRTRQHPTTKAGRADALRRQKAINAEIFVAAIAAMNLWMCGDAAIMRADHVMPGNRRPPYRATRLWVKRDGRWQMAISQQTTRAAR